jgi:DNA-binding beta-propeller fold protein YncE
VWNVGRIPASMNDSSTSEFDLPRGITVGEGGSVLVMDTFRFDITKLSKAGKVLGTFGTRGVSPGEFNFPNAISSLGNKIAVADKENNRVQVLRLVGQ